MWLAKLRSVFNAVRRRPEFEDQMAEEMQFHLEARADDLMSRRGLQRDEAVRQARIEFGSVQKYREEGRTARGLRLADEFIGDIRYASRQFRRDKGFTALVIFILAVGIGANTAVFNRLNDVLLKKLPVETPEDLRQLWWTSHSPFRIGGNVYQVPDETHRTSFSYAAYRHIRDRATSFSDLMAFGGLQTFNIGIAGRAEPATGLLVSGNFFRGLGVQAAAGRMLQPEDDNPQGTAAPAAVLSHAFWNRAFAGDLSVIGRPITVNGLPVTVVGIMPEGFRSINPDWHPDILLPVSLQPAVGGGNNVLADPGIWTILVYGRLRPGVSDERARTETETLLRQAVLAYPPLTADRELPQAPEVTLALGGWGFRSLDIASPFRRLHSLLHGIVGLVLLIACSNVAGMLLARATARRREIGARLALGASRARVTRQLLTESLLLSACAGILGAAIVLSPIFSAPEPDTRVFAFSAGISALAALLFGLAPAIASTRIDLVSTLKQTAAPGGRSRFRGGKVLVTVQVALSLVLLVGAGLFARTLFNLRAQTFGFRTDNLLVFRMNPSLNGYRDERLRNFHEDALNRIQSVPGVVSASMSRWGILTMAWASEPICVDGRDPQSVSFHAIAPRFFETMGIPRLVGRDIDWRDREDAPFVVLVNQSFAKAFFGDANPVGRSLEVCSGDREGPPREIVGVVGDTKYSSIRAAAQPTVYVPYRQGNERWMTFAVHTAGNPGATLPAIRRALAELDGNVPMYDVATQAEWIDQNVRQEQELAVTLVAFGAIAVLLACSGIYGTLAYLVSRRTPEIGLRMALGAPRRAVAGIVIRESLTPVALGIAGGAIGVVASARLIREMLFGVPASDPWTLTAAATLLVFVSFAAALIPARRASRIDPLTALKHE